MARRDLGNIALTAEDTRAVWTWMLWEQREFTEGRGPDPATLCIVIAGCGGFVRGGFADEGPDADPFSRTRYGNERRELHDAEVRITIAGAAGRHSHHAILKRIVGGYGRYLGV